MSHIAIDAIAYWQAVTVSQPNGWGMRIDPTFTDMRGRTGVVSHHALGVYYSRHGAERFDRALDVLFSKPGKKPVDHRE